MVVRRVIAVIGALTALLGAACGGSDGQIRAVADPEVSALVGVLISGAFSAFPMSGPGFTALVDGGWPGLPDRPAVIRYQKEGQSEPTVVAMPAAIVAPWSTPGGPGMQSRFSRPPARGGGKACGPCSTKTSPLGWPGGAGRARSTCGTGHRPIGSGRRSPLRCSTRQRATESPRHAGNRSSSPSRRTLRWPANRWQRRC